MPEQNSHPQNSFLNSEPTQPPARKRSVQRPTARTSAPQKRTSLNSFEANGNLFGGTAASRPAPPTKNNTSFASKAARPTVPPQKQTGKSYFDAYPQNTTQAAAAPHTVSQAPPLQRAGQNRAAAAKPLFGAEEPIQTTTAEKRSTAKAPLVQKNYSQKSTAASARRAEKKQIQKQKRLNIAIVSCCVVLVLAVLAGIFLPGILRDDSFNFNLVPGEGNEIPAATESNQPDTLLAPTEDAGLEYIESTLFIGDSNTHRLPIYGDITGVTNQTSIGIDGMSITGVIGTPCVQFAGYNNLVTIPKAVSLMQPRRIVIMFGTNDAGSSTTETFIENYKLVLEALNEAYPYADIIIASILPIAQTPKGSSLTNERIELFNIELLQLAQSMNCKFLNWSEALRDIYSGNAKSGSMAEDGIHITSSAAEEMCTYFRTHSYITEDRRPPLSDIPERIDAASPFTGGSSGSGGTGNDNGNTGGGSASSGGSSSAQTGSDSQTPQSETPPTDTGGSSSANGGDDNTDGTTPGDTGDEGNTPAPPDENTGTGGETPEPNETTPVT